jgi:hypothetical protein
MDFSNFKRDAQASAKKIDANPKALQDAGERERARRG